LGEGVLRSRTDKDLFGAEGTEIRKSKKYRNKKEQE
jgi:hypothetical protein